MSRPRKVVTYNGEIKWLKKHKDHLKISVIERELGMYENLLTQFLLGAINLPDKWHKPLTQWIRKFKK